jgi:hypothetical protein
VKICCGTFNTKQSHCGVSDWLSLNSNTTRSLRGPTNIRYTVDCTASMAQAHDENLARIRKYVTDARGLQDDPMDFDASSTEARLEQTLRELRERVQEQHTALERVCWLSI